MLMKAPLITTKACLVAILVIGAGCSSDPKPATAEPTLAAGVARLQANDSEGAAKILEQVTTHEPRNGRAWRNLALAYQNLKDWDRAISADAMNSSKLLSGSRKKTEAAGILASPNATERLI